MTTAKQAGLENLPDPILTAAALDTVPQQAPLEVQRAVGVAAPGQATVHAGGDGGK